MAISHVALVRELNLQAVYQAVREQHPVSRAQLARTLVTSKPTTGRSIDALLAAGLIREAEPPVDATGYGAVFFEPRPDAAVVLGLDVGSRYLRGVLADLDGTQLARIDIPLKSVRSVVDKSVEMRDRLVEQAGVNGPTVAVVGVAGVIDPVTGHVRVANQVELNGFAAAEELRAALDVPVTVENDVNLAAVGEGWLGAGVEVENFAFLAVGSGVGAGLVLAGQLHRGHHGAAGEIDYVRPGRQFEPDSPAADAFLDYAQRRMTGPLTAEAIMDAARKGDRAANAAIKHEAERIARCAAVLTKVVDLELIVLGGGIGLNGDLLLEPVQRKLATVTPYPPRIEVSRLGAAATLTGATALALDAVHEDLVPSRVVAAG